ncbi:MAG TPA: FG-GAP-like repeat-containing protein, partial [Planctomycetaceae bacterium]|nr:FG-GAP-like repeat-containing protein [Planctomycetaceae bacterium]
IERATLKRWAAVEPSAIGPKLGLAALALERGEYDLSRKLAAETLDLAPHCLAAHVALGEALLQGGKTSDLRLWNARLPPDADTSPDVWRLRGLWLTAESQHDAALACLFQAIELDPNDLGSIHPAARQLAVDGRDAEAQPLLRRAAGLEQYHRTVDVIADDDRNLPLLRQAARLAEELGRIGEARAWLQLVLALDPQSETDWKHSQRLKTELGRTNSPTALPADLQAILAANASPLPDWSTLKFAEDGAEHAPRDKAAADSIRLEDVAAEVGLDFRFENGHRNGAEGRRTFEFTGGGVAVIDFDADGRPDLYFAQGSTHPHEPGPPDQLFRNVRGGMFHNVGGQAGLTDHAYSQGVTVGDFDNDGFPDLYVANIGPNRLYRNNGDGTLADASEAAGTAGNAWSTSCVLADFNGDALPDLYVVNYLSGDDVFTRVCRDRDGELLLCFPQVFPAAADEFYLNQGDGRFLPVPAGLEALTAGRGLGVVAADFLGTGQLGLFVANDTTPNFLLVNQNRNKGEAPVFVDEAVARGVAYDFAGRSQACMGIASADVDGDGRLDLYVTNFESEWNALYRQSAPGLFLDSIQQSGIADASYRMLGFGTQFLDADADGRPDLFVANGHIDDLSRHGSLYRMPAQMFRGLGQGRFREVPAPQLGPYFERLHLGRAVARLDWNGDRLDDLVVTDLEAPPALLSNTTPALANRWAIELRGTRSARDGIGATISIKAGEHRSTQQLTAGDGYFASNQRQLLFAVPGAAHLDEISVRWPAGDVQTISGPIAPGRLLVVEGCRSVPQ